MNEPIPTTWIPVDERLPEPNTPVLIHYGNGSTAVAMRMEFDGLNFVSVDGPASYKPSHWQPLPPPPPKPDAFETWWNAQPISYEIMSAKPKARMVWDTAVEATKREQQ